MGKRVIRRRTIRQRHLIHEAGNVVLIVGEALDVSFERIPHEPARASLATPIQHGDGKASPPKLAYHLEIFLDELGAAGEDAHRAVPLFQRRRPSRVAQTHAAFALKKSHRRAERDWVLRSCNEVHERPCEAVLASLIATLGRAGRFHWSRPENCPTSLPDRQELYYLESNT